MRQTFKSVRCRTLLSRLGRKAGSGGGALCLLLALVIGHSLAQDVPDLTHLSLEELMKVEVYSASKDLELTTNAPSSVTIITRDEIRNYGYRTLADVLRSVRGFFVTSDRNYSYIGARGFTRGGDYNDRILLLIDGHRLNDALYDGALLGTEFPLDVDLIERVEVVRGPSSSLYGTSAFFGVINVITRKSATFDHVAVSTEAGSFGSYKGRVTFSTDVKSRVQAIISGSFHESAGHQRLYYPEYADASTSLGVAVNADDDSSRDLFSDITYGDFNLRAVYGTREKGIPTGAFDTVFGDPRNRTTDSLGYVDFGYKHKAYGWDWSSQVSFNHYTYDGTYVYSHDSGSVVNRDFGAGDWWGGEVQAKKDLGDHHRVTLGTEIRDNTRQDQRNLDLEPFVVHLNDHHDSVNWAAYAQDVFQVRHNLAVNAGIRLDRSSFGGTTNPRLALIYKPLDKTTIKFLFGQAFRAPNAYELFYSDGQSGKSNPNLLPERIRTYELTADRFLGGHLRLGGSAYRYDIRDLIVQQSDSDNFLVFRNSSRVRTYGLEGEVEGRWSNGLQSRWSYAVQKATDRQSNASLIGSPKHLAKANLIIPIMKRSLFLGLEAQYVSKRRTLAGQDVAGALIANATLFRKQVVKHLEVSASANNIFDRRYADPGGEEHRQVAIPQDGRAFRLKLGWGL